jgi:hypothetical protein
MSQLCLPFAEEIEPKGASRTTLYWRKRIDRAVRAAFEIGRRQRKPAPQTHSVGAAVAPMPARFEPMRDEANELLAIAARLARLTVSRKDPHAFFEEKSSLVFELRQIARRSGATTLSGRQLPAGVR